MSETVNLGDVLTDPEGLPDASLLLLPDDEDLTPDTLVVIVEDDDEREELAGDYPVELTAQTVQEICSQATAEPEDLDEQALLQALMDYLDDDIAAG